MYYFDTKKSINKNDDLANDYPKSSLVSLITLLNTVFENKQAFSKREIRKADEARTLQKY